MSLRDDLRVLVVDDMSTSRGLMRQALDVLGISHVGQAEDGAAAWSVIRHDPPDLVLSDLVMPRMSGLDLLGAIRADDVTRGCRFILVTGSDRHEALRRAPPRGCDGVLSKPFKTSELLACIESVMGRL